MTCVYSFRDDDEFHILLFTRLFVSFLCQSRNLDRRVKLKEKRVGFTTSHHINIFSGGFAVIGGCIYLASHLCLISLRDKAELHLLVHRITLFIEFH